MSDGIASGIDTIRDIVTKKTKKNLMVAIVTLQPKYEKPHYCKE